MKHYFSCGQPTEDGTLCQRSVSYLAPSCGIHDIPRSHWATVDFPSSPRVDLDSVDEPSTINFDEDSPDAELK